MNKAVYYKFLFFIAGAWNVLACLIFAILAPIFPNFMSFFGFETATNEVLFWMYLFLILAFVEGFKFFLVGLDIRKNHLVVSTGMIAKFMTTVLVVVFFSIGTLKWPMLVIGGTDLVFTALFIEFYVNYKRLLDADIQGAYAYREK